VSDRSLRRSIALVAAALVAVVVLGAVKGSRAVGHDLRQRAETALTAAGLGDVTVDFAGREAALSGGNDVEARLAAALVAALPGVRRVDEENTAEPPLPGVSRFELDRAGDDVEISGAVPSPDDAAAIKISTATALRATITGDVTVDSAVKQASWTASLPEVLQIVAGVEGLELEIPGDGTLQLGGAVGDGATRSRIVEQVADTLPHLELVEDLRVVATPRKGD
jgi:hypothetical protein